MDFQTVQLRNLANLEQITSERQLMMHMVLARKIVKWDSMLKPGLSYCNDTYILSKGTTN